VDDDDDDEEEGLRCWSKTFCLLIAFSISWKSNRSEWMKWEKLDLICFFLPTLLVFLFHYLLLPKQSQNCFILFYFVLFCFVLDKIKSYIFILLSSFCVYKLVL
jgi:hypothetical protein